MYNILIKSVAVCTVGVMLSFMTILGGATLLHEAVEPVEENLSP